jgi:hypothetical protein
MAVNKNFVVKNGLEVNTNLILADAATDKVGIGTTVPGYTLDVAGGIGATSVYAAGFSTFIGDVKIGSAQTTLTAIGNSVGVGTDTPSYLLDVRSAVSTGATSLYVKGDARITGKLDVAGDITYDEVTGRNLYITGLSTFVGLSSAQEVRVGAGISVVGVSTFHSNITVAGLSTFTGISTFGSAVHVGGALDVIGISTFKGNIDANGALDVDGQTDLDVLNVSDTATFAAGLVANGDVDLGNATSDTITPTGRFDAALVPASDGAIDLGTSSLEWRNVYVDGHTELDDVNVSGASTFAGAAKFDGAIDANGALDVDGHTELDDVNVSGASTFAGAADFNGAVDIDGHTELDDVNVSGMATLGGANIVAAGGTFQVGAGGTVLYVDTDGTLTIGSATTLATVSLNGGSIPSIGLVIALGG